MVQKRNYEQISRHLYTFAIAVFEWEIIGNWWVQFEWKTYKPVVMCSTVYTINDAVHGSWFVDSARLTREGIQNATHTVSPLFLPLLSSESAPMRYSISPTPSLTLINSVQLYCLSHSWLDTLPSPPPPNPTPRTPDGPDPIITPPYARAKPYLAGINSYLFGKHHQSSFVSITNIFVLCFFCRPLWTYSTDNAELPSLNWVQGSRLRTAAM
jgi:hypothetical protein